MSDFLNMSAVEISEGIKTKKFKATQVMESFLGQVSALDSNLNGYLKLKSKT